MTCLRSHITTAAATLVAVAVLVLPGAAEWLDLRPDAVLQGQVWRLLTAHFTHCGISHLSWDLLMFALLGGAIEQRLGIQDYSLLLLFLTGALGSILLFILPEHFLAYRGLSGIDSALFAFITGTFAIELRGKRRVIPLLMLLLFIIKTCLEVRNGDAMFVADQRMVVMPVAHLLGATLGVISLAFMRCFSTSVIMSDNQTPKEV